MNDNIIVKQNNDIDVSNGCIFYLEVNGRYEMHCTLPVLNSDKLIVVLC